MRLIGSAILSLLLFSLSGTTQTTSPPDPYKSVLDRLKAISTMQLDSWTFVGTDLPHGENPGALSDAKPLVLKKNLELPLWAYETVEIPQALNGYSTAGTRVRLSIGVGGNTGTMITVFVNGNMVAHGDQDSQVPITLTQSAQPGQKLLIAVRILNSGLVGCCGGPPVTSIESATLMFDPPEPRPDPAILRQEIMAAELLIAAYPDGKAQREQQLDAAVKAIDLGALDKNDQSRFDASLKAAQS